MKNPLFSGRATRLPALVVVLAGLSGAVANPRAKPGIVGKSAPSWGVREWINLPDKKTTLDIAEFKGKVVYLFCFQSWCPGCHSSGFPTLRTMIDRFQDADDVAFVAVQTVFEGFSTNTADRAWETAREYKLNIPVGHSGTDNRRSVLMQRYRTGGTPWVVIIDKQGIVRYNAFRITPGRAQKMIDELRQKADSPPSKSKIQEKERSRKADASVRLPDLRSTISHRHRAGIDPEPLSRPPSTGLAMGLRIGEMVVVQHRADIPRRLFWKRVPIEKRQYFRRALQ